VYTPTVGQACLNFGALYRRSRGMYFSSLDKGEMRSMVYNWPEDEVRASRSRPHVSVCVC